MSFRLPDGEPDYSHYSRLIEVNLTKAAWLIASAQLSDSEFESEDHYNTEFAKLNQKVTSVLIQSVSNEEVTVDPLIDGETITYNEYGVMGYMTDKIYIKIKELCSWAMAKRYNLPDELKHLTGQGEVESQKIPEKTLRPSQIAKIKCQAIAQTLWMIYPGMTTEEMKKHPAILEFGGGKDFQGKNTLRDWLSEVDPRPNDKKPGPKNVKA